MRQRFNLSIVIPCLNEEKTITRAVKQAATALRQLGIEQAEIIVADNGSTDRSLIKLQRQQIARVVSVPIKGYGAALHWGILHARGQYVLFADADLSYRFQQLTRFWSVVLKYPKVDVVLGSRFRGEIKPRAMPWLHRYLGTPVLTLLLRWVYGLPTSDCNSGMRLIRRRFYLHLQMKNAGMEWASELLIKTALEKGVYREVPITLYPDQRGRRPHLAAWSDGWRHLKAIVLLKPNILLVITVGLVGCAFISWVSPELRLFWLLTAGAFLLCSLAAKLIKFAIDGKPSWMSQWLLRLPLVPIAIVGVLVGASQFLLLPAHLQVLKILIVHAILMYCLWVFFIETIKTHLIHNLPNSIPMHRS